MITIATRTSWPDAWQVCPGRSVSRNVPMMKRPSCWTSSRRAPHGRPALNALASSCVASWMVSVWATIAGSAKKLAARSLSPLRSAAAQAAISGRRRSASRCVGLGW